jgi:exopolysaccharide biosynthesis polyprenyl glycosylphosphotransferase
MLREHRILVRRALVYLDVTCAFVAYALSIQARDMLDEIGNHTFVMNEWTHLLLAGTAIPVLWLMYRLSGVYHSQRMFSRVREVRKLVACNLFTFMLLLALAFALDLPAANRLQIGFFVAFDTLLVVALHLSIRTGSRHARARGYNWRNLLIVSPPGQEIGALVARVSEHAGWGFRVVGIALPRALVNDPAIEKALERAGIAPDVPRVALDQSAALLDSHPVDELWIEGFPDPSSPAAALATQASDRGVTTRYVLSHSATPGHSWTVDSVGNLTTLAVIRTPADEVALALKRALDLTVAIFALLLIWPLLAVVSLLLFAERNGPVLFRQERVGRNGRRFTLYKFRSMVPDAEQRLAGLAQFNEMQGPTFKIKNDPRVTPLGRWMRKLSIDELPQLFNVIKGEMSLVGPRPPLPSEVDLYAPSQRRRLSVRPGITGLWQVRGRNEIQDFERWVKLDLEYIDHWSLQFDLWILLATIPAVLSARGAR